MNRSYFTWEEQEADKQGHEDERRHRSDYEHDKNALDGVDRAYWDGRKDEARNQRIEEEERQMEADREQREFERRKQEEEDRDRAEDDYLRQEREDFENRMMREDMESQDDEYPITEEDLFREIEEDERNDNEDNPW